MIELYPCVSGLHISPTAPRPILWILARLLFVAFHARRYATVATRCQLQSRGPKINIRPWPLCSQASVQKYEVGVHSYSNQARPQRPWPPPYAMFLSPDWDIYRQQCGLWNVDCCWLVNRRDALLWPSRLFPSSLQVRNAASAIDVSQKCKLEQRRRKRITLFETLFIRST